MILEIKNLDFKYDNSDELVLNDFSLDIEKGNIVSILGQSGSGKSTLLRIIAGLEAPSRGSIILNDNIIVDEKTFISPEKRGIGMLFQDYALFPHLNVYDNIDFGLHKLKKENRKERIEEVLNLVGLCEYKKRYPYELSGGQQQRVALARALAPKPLILLMDEPFSNLDADLKTKIRIELKEILKSEKMTCVFVTHDKVDAYEISDVIITMEQNNIKNSTLN